MNETLGFICSESVNSIPTYVMEERTIIRDDTFYLFLKNFFHTICMFMFIVLALLRVSVKSYFYFVSFLEVSLSK